MVEWNITLIKEEGSSILLFEKIKKWNMTISCFSDDTLFPETQLISIEIHKSMNILLLKAIH